MKISHEKFNIFKGSFFPLLSFIFGIILLLLLFLFIKPASVFASFGEISLWQFGLILAIRLVFWTLSALRWKIILDFYQQKVSFLKLYLFKLAAFSVSYFTPITAVGGQAAGVVLLKNEKVPVKIGITTVFIDSILASFVSVTISLFALVLFLLIKFSSVPFLILALIALFSVVLFLTLFFIVFRIDKPILGKSRTKALSKWKTTLKDFLFIFSDFFRKNKKGALYLVVLIFFAHASKLLEIFLILSFLGITLDIIDVAIIEAGYIFSFIVPVPQALGTAEAVGAYALQALGHGAALGISLTLILRIRHLLAGLAGIAVLIFYGLFAFVYSKDLSKGEKK